VTDTPDPAPLLGRPGQAYEAARLRWATLADGERLADLWRRAYPEEEASPASVRKWLERGGALLLQDRGGGLLAALPWREAEGGWQVERVATAPGERGQGYGRWLVTKVEALAIKSNVPYLWLRLPHGDDDADQLAYYARMGYLVEAVDEVATTLRKRVGGVWQTKAEPPSMGPRDAGIAT
jgi:GNAT superfamily N-acetyltransferase